MDHLTQPSPLPKHAMNLAKRVLQKLATQKTTTITVFMLGSSCYAIVDGGAPERLGNVPDVATAASETLDIAQTL